MIIKDYEKMDALQLLEELSEAMAAQDVVRLNKQEAIDQVLTPEIKAQLAAIDAEFDPLLDAAGGHAGIVEGHLKNRVIALGQSVKGQQLHAVFSYRTTWDNKKLEGYAAAHPEINAFKKSTSSVAIRKVG